MERFNKWCKQCSNNGNDAVCDVCLLSTRPCSNETPYYFNKKSQSARLSFREAYRRAAAQTEMQACTDSRKGMMTELCYIIAEVYMMDTNSKIAVGGEPLDAYLVKDVFAELRYPHLEMVTDNFEGETKYIKNKRAYLRTALYNSVFELEAHYTNLVKSGGVV